MHGCVHRHPCQPGVTPGSLVAALRPRHRVHFPWCLGAGRASSSQAESWAGGPPLPGRAAGGSVCAPRCPEAHGRQAGSACSRSQGWSCTLSIKCWTSGCSRKPVSVKGTLEETLEEMGLKPWHSLKGQCFRQRERGNLKPFSLPCSLSPQPALSESRQETKVCLHCPSEAKPHKLARPPGFDVILKFSVPFRNRRRKPKSSYQVQRVKPVSSPPRGKSLTQNLRPDVGSFLLWFLAKFSPQKGSS